MWAQISFVAIASRGLWEHRYTPLDRLQIVSVGSFRHQVTSTRMEYKKGPAGKMMYADQRTGHFRYCFICLQLAEMLSAVSGFLIYSPTLHARRSVAEQPIIEALAAFSTLKTTSKL